MLAALAVVAVIFASARASLSSDPQALARIGMPLGGGTTEQVSLVTGPHSTPIAVVVRHDRVYPQGTILAGERVSLQVVVKRPGWIAWLGGGRRRLSLDLTTPTASLRSHYITLPRHDPLRLHFKAPIEVYASGAHANGLTRHVLARPTDVITLPRGSEAGSVFLAAAPRRWESAAPRMVSWFPAGGSASAVTSPAPGAHIKPTTKITVSFSKPVGTVLGSHRPVLTPATPGHWRTLTGHAIQFVPTGYGYGLGAKVSIGVPAGVRLVGAPPGPGPEWTVPDGSIVRLQQILAIMGYLPLKFHYARHAPGRSAAAQEDAAVKAPAGRFTWRYPNTPAWLKGMWRVGASGVMMQGALMAFERDHGLTTDGVTSPVVWNALIAALVAGKHSTSGYTLADVDENSQTLNLWHDGKVVITTPVNTGAAGTPTSQGIFTVKEHLVTTTMSGTNPDGSHYSDPDIPYVSYFNGGDALHGFTRAEYGSPQSLGCVEMPIATAGRVFPYTPVGTLVHVA